MRNTRLRVYVGVLEGLLYVVEYGNHRMQAFNKRTFQFVAMTGKNGGDGTNGNGDNEFGSPVGVAVDSSAAGLPVKMRTGLPTQHRLCSRMLLACASPHLSGVLKQPPWACPSSTQALAAVPLYRWLCRWVCRTTHLFLWCLYCIHLHPHNGDAHDATHVRHPHVTACAGCTL